MKILFETGSTCVGGAERVVLRLAQGIRRLRPDWQVDGIVLAERGGLETEYRQTFMRLHDGPGPGRHDQAGNAIIDLVQQHGYDVVHCIDSFTQTSIAAEACVNTKFLQNVFPNCRTSPFAPPIEWLTDKNNPYAAIVTEFIGNLCYLPKPGRAPHMLDSVANGIDTNFWCPGERERTIDVCWVGRTDAEKGLRVAMDLVPTWCHDVQGHGPGSMMIVINEKDGEHLDELYRLAEEYKTFTWAWKLPPDSLREVYRRSKIYLHTATVEGMPATPLEASACGCRPLCNGVDGVREVFGAGTVLGRFTYEGRESPNADKLSLRLYQILHHPGIKPFGGNPWSPEGCKQARKLIVEKFTVDKMIEEYLDIYERMVGA